MATRRRPPGPRGLPILGSVVSYCRDRLTFLRSAARTYGDVVHFRFGTDDVFLLNRPEYVQTLLLQHQTNIFRGEEWRRSRVVLGEGLLTSEGELHRRQRKLALPAFHGDRIAAYGAGMVAQAAELATRWRAGATVDMVREMADLTLTIVGDTLFDADATPKSVLGQTIRDAGEFLWPVPLSIVALRAILPLPGARRFRATRRRLDASADRLFEPRRANYSGVGNLVATLAREGATGGRDGGVGRRQMCDEVVTFLLAGSEAPSLALSWTLYLLARHRDVEATLHAELDQALGGRLPTVEDLPRLEYTRMVFAEAMRCYPPVPVLSRQAIRPIDIGPYTLPAGSTILVSPWVVHHDPRYYPDPFRFDPQRWTPERLAARPKFSYFPFGGGHQRCIGESFSWTEGVLLLATLAQTWQPRLVSSRPIKLRPRATLRPASGMPMRLERRQQDLSLGQRLAVST